MSVLINFKVCDNSPDCTGIQDCPTGALYWDEEKRTIAFNEDDCTLCGVCEDACLVDAIRVASTDEEYQRIKKEIDEDPRKVTDLFVDRYGAQPIQEAFLAQQDKFDIQILQSTKLTAVEVFNDDSIECLISSIPVKELLEKIPHDLTYRKLEITDSSLLESYDVQELPALLFFNNGTLLNKIEGYYDTTRKTELIERITSITA